MDNTILFTVNQPTLELVTVQAFDDETPDPNLGDKGVIRTSAVLGSLAPYIMIGAATFTHESIFDMVIDETGFLPTIKVTIIDHTGSFSGAYFPKENPILSLYIRSRNGKYKPLRNDFLITKISPNGSMSGLGAAEGVGMTYYISGVLFIPDIFTAVSKSYPGKTSMEALYAMSVELQIGFSTNEDHLHDDMTWINPYWQYARMIKHVADHAYKNDQSFFAAYVDKFYCLNFINVPQMVSEEDSFDTMWYNLNNYEDILKTKDGGTGYQDQLTNSAPDTLYLTNFMPLIKSDIFIKEIRPISNVGSIFSSIGTFGQIYYYDHFLSADPSSNFVQFDISPMLPVQYTNQDMRNSYSGFWEGVDYNNNHDNFAWTKYNNYLSIVSLNQMTLEVVLNGTNLSIHRGMRVPVFIVREGRDAAIKYGSTVNMTDADATLNAASQSTGIYRDTYLSGYYIVTGIKYNFKAFTDIDDSNDSNFYTELTLARKTWPKTRVADDNKIV